MLFPPVPPEPPMTVLVAVPPVPPEPPMTVLVAVPPVPPELLLVRGVLDEPPVPPELLLEPNALDAAALPPELPEEDALVALALPPEAPAWPASACGRLLPLFRARRPSLSQPRPMLTPTNKVKTKMDFIECGLQW